MTLKTCGWRSVGRPQFSRSLSMVFYVHEHMSREYSKHRYKTIGFICESSTRAKLSIYTKIISVLSTAMQFALLLDSYQPTEKAFISASKGPGKNQT